MVIQSIYKSKMLGILLIRVFSRQTLIVTQRGQFVDMCMCAGRFV